MSLFFNVTVNEGSTPNWHRTQYFKRRTDIRISIFIHLLLLKNVYYVLHIFLSFLCLFSYKRAGTDVCVHAMKAYVGVHLGGTAPFKLNFGIRRK
jgi:hypothetical protein